MHGRLESGEKERHSGVGTTVVAIAASAGGLAAISTVLAALPADTPGAFVVVQHLSRNHPSVMAEILARRTPLRVKQAEDGDRLEAGSVLVGPPDKHLLARPDRTVSLTTTEAVHFVRPSADLLFESVATSFGENAIAVILSGTGTDGVQGLAAVKRARGTVIAQDKATSQHFGMPGAAIAQGHADLILPIGEIAHALLALLRERESA